MFPGKIANGEQPSSSRVSDEKPSTYSSTGNTLLKTPGQKRKPKEPLSKQSSEDSTADGILDEIELIFHPHPDFGLSESRYIKTTGNATIAHLAKFLIVRSRLDKDRNEGLTAENYKVYALTETHDYHELEEATTLGEANSIHWTEDKPLELYFAPVLIKIEE